MTSDRLDLPESAELVRIDGIALRAARTAIQITPELQAVFARSDEEQWPEGRLTFELAAILPEYVIDDQSCPAVAEALAREHMARDKDKILLVSRQTGLPLAQVPPDAIYVPAPVAREGTTELAQPLPRLRPEVESAIVQHQFMRGHELARLKDLSGRTDLQLWDEDPRLLIVTSRGRKQLLERLRREAPLLLNPGETAGVVNEFLGICERGDVIADYGPELTFSLEAFTTVSLVDFLAKSTRHDPYLAVRETLRNQLVREIAMRCAGAAHMVLGSDVASVRDILGPGVMVATPDTAAALRPRSVLAIEGAVATLFQRGPHLNPMSFDCQARDYQRKWEVYVSVELGVRTPIAGVSVYEFSDLKVSEPMVEVL